MGFQIIDGVRKHLYRANLMWFTCICLLTSEGNRDAIIFGSVYKFRRCADCNMNSLPLQSDSYIAWFHTYSNVEQLNNISISPLTANQNETHLLQQWNLLILLISFHPHLTPQNNICCRKANQDNVNLHPTNTSLKHSSSWNQCVRVL